MRTGARTSMAHLQVLLRRHRLDRELAEGRPPTASAPLLLRSRQLTGREERASLAARLHELACEADRGDPVRVWRGSLIELARALEGPEPVEVIGLARLSLFLTRECEPLFSLTPDERVGASLQAIATGLRPQTGAAGSGQAS